MQVLCLIMLFIGIIALLITKNVRYSIRSGIGFLAHGRLRSLVGLIEINITLLCLTASIEEWKTMHEISPYSTRNQIQ